MPFTCNLLVIANRTIDSPELLRSLRDRAARGPVAVTLVAPAPLGSQADVRARLERALASLAEAGIAASGVIAGPDPMVALADAWDPRRFDEVVVVTLPSGTSRWLAVDLPRRAERLTGASVTHVVGRPAVGAQPGGALAGR